MVLAFSYVTHPSCSFNSNIISSRPLCSFFDMIALSRMGTLLASSMLVIYSSLPCGVSKVIPSICFLLVGIPRGSWLHSLGHLLVRSSLLVLHSAPSRSSSTQPLLHAASLRSSPPFIQPSLVSRGASTPFPWAIFIDLLHVDAFLVTWWNHPLLFLLPPFQDGHYLIRLPLLPCRGHLVHVGFTSLVRFRTYINSQIFFHHSFDDLVSSKNHRIM